MTTPTVTELVRNGNRVGKRVELARYTIPAGERVLYGQRINGVVRFQPGRGVVLVGPSRLTEDDGCRSREAPLEAGRPNAARHKNDRTAVTRRKASRARPASRRTSHERHVTSRQRAHRDPR